MFRLSFTARLALGSVVVAGLAGLIVGLPLQGTTRALLETALQRRAEGSAETIASALGDISIATTTRAALDERVRDLAEESGLDLLTLADQAGNVVASTDSSLRTGVPDPLLAEAGVSLVDLADEDAAATPVRVDAAGRASVLAVAPVEDAYPPLFIAVRAPAAWSSTLHALNRRILLSVLAWMVVAAVLGVVMTRRSLRPLDRLARAVRALAAGDAQTDLPRSGVTELDALADDFDRMRRAITARERWLRALAGTVAHEVRNPANALRLQLDLLQRALGEGAPEDRQELAAARFERLYDELDELEATVSSLLAFAEGAPARRVRVPLLAMLRKAAAGASVQGPDITVAVDPVLVERAIANLVRNARQAGATTVSVQANVDSDGLILVVQDNGRGFPAPMVSQALEPFARGEGGGSGLGLALVAAVAQAHGGQAAITDPGPDPTRVEVRLLLA
ncbi:MAG: HAMP domain-containing histidine kinase [Oligoflexia bacterium]|nr:HAMP domain-containing histidine kinase [Oligoflexia bacterium]